MKRQVTHFDGGNLILGRSCQLCSVRTEPSWHHAVWMLDAVGVFLDVGACRFDLCAPLRLQIHMPLPLPRPDPPGLHLGARLRGRPHVRRGAHRGDGYQRGEWPARRVETGWWLSVCYLNTRAGEQGGRAAGQIRLEREVKVEKC